jgi:hypothetical protein
MRGASLGGGRLTSFIFPSESIEKVMFVQFGSECDVVFAILSAPRQSCASFSSSQKFNEVEIHIEQEIGCHIEAALGPCTKGATEQVRRLSSGSGR